MAILVIGKEGSTINRKFLEYVKFNKSLQNLV